MAHSDKRQSGNAALNAERPTDQRLQLAELEHRSANVLAAIAGLISIEQRNAGHDCPALLRLHDQVHALALIQRMLRRNTKDRLVDIGALIEALAKQLAMSILTQKGIDVVTRVPSLMVQPRLAQSIALIVVEVVTNSAKHAFPTADGVPAIDICLTNQSGSFSLAIRDNGSGFDTSAPEVRSGQRLLRMLAQSCQANMTVESGMHGTTVTINAELA